MLKLLSILILASLTSCESIFGPKQKTIKTTVVQEGVTTTTEIPYVSPLEQAKAIQYQNHAEATKELFSE